MQVVYLHGNAGVIQLFQQLHQLVVDGGNQPVTRLGGSGGSGGGGGHQW